MLEARVNPTHFMNTVTAFSGREYVKSEWRPVPTQYEVQARSHEMLEVRERDGSSVTAPTEILPGPKVPAADLKGVQEPEPKVEAVEPEPKGRSRRKNVVVATDDQLEAE